MNTRRDALKLMAAGLGSWLLPSIGLSQTRWDPNIMGVDLLDGRLNCIIKTPTTALRVQCGFEHLSGIMHKFKIDQCVIDKFPFGLEVLYFGLDFPNRVTTCTWLSEGSFKAYAAHRATDSVNTKNISIRCNGAYRHVSANAQFWKTRKIPAEAHCQVAGVIHSLGI